MKKLVVLEFSKPGLPVMKQLYNFYMKIIAPAMATLFSKNKGAYKYLGESIQQFPEGKKFIAVLKDVGYVNTYCKPLSFGICSIYCGEK